MADIQTYGKFDMDFTNQIMELQSAYTSIALQEVYDTAHDAMAEIQNMDNARIASASGQEDLGGGLATGLTVRMLNGWRVKAADRGGPGFVRVSIDGGNLVTSAANGPDPNDPLAPADYVTYSLSKAASSTETTQAKINDLFSIHTGRWKIDSKQKTLTNYASDNVTPIVTFQLKDKDGNLTDTSPFERMPI